jgi:hypothetical protein
LVKILPAIGSVDQLAVVRLASRFPIETLKGIHYVVEADELSGWPLPEVGSCLDGAGIRSPGRKDRPLFLSGHIRIVNNLHGGPESSRWMEKTVEVKILSVLVLHRGHILREATWVGKF